jgi:hypothetical protein
MALALRRERGGHSSWAHVATRLTQPTRTVGRKQPSKVSPRTAPIRFCSRWGLPCRSCCQSRGGLLPHPFTLAVAEAAAVCFLWHFPWGRPRRPLAGTVSPWSPDFPHPQPFGSRECGRPASWQARIKGFPPENANEKARRVAQMRSVLGQRHARNRHAPPKSTSQTGLKRANPAPPSAPSPCCNRRPRPDSSAWRHDRHCISGSCRRWCRRRGLAPWQGTSCRI